jgi:hypothetical protein
MDYQSRRRNVATTLNKGDKVRVNLDIEGTVTYRDIYDNSLEVEDKSGRVLMYLKPSEVTRVIPTEPGLGSVVQIDGKRWIHLGGYSEWSEMDKRKDSSTFTNGYVSWSKFGRKWAEIYKPGYHVLVHAL